MWRKYGHSARARKDAQGFGRRSVRSFGVVGASASGLRTGPWTQPAYPGVLTFELGDPDRRPAHPGRRTSRRPHPEQSSSLQTSDHRARMALTRGSPEPHARALPSAWTYSDGGSTLQEAQEALDSYKKKDGNKGACAYDGLCASRAGYKLTYVSPFRAVVVRFKAVGNAPIMKQNFYKITASNRFQAVIQFLRKELGWKQGDPLVRSPCARCVFCR